MFGHLSLEFDLALPAVHHTHNYQAKKEISMVNQPQEKSTSEELAQRKAWFKEYTTGQDDQPEGLPLRCPCCYCRTLSERGSFDICPICYWEDDGQDEYDADVLRGGPNGNLSLTRARLNYEKFGAIRKGVLDYVRKPGPEELPYDNAA